MKITFVTLFEELIAPYFCDSILKRAIDRGIFAIDFINPRDFSADKWKKTDDAPTGGGAGMVMTPQPLFDALNSLLRRSPNAKIVFTAPAGKPFNNKDAKRLSACEHLVIVCGRYEGIDERVIERFADEVFSIGDYVLTGGELPALVMSDAIVRFLDGALGNADSVQNESFEDGAIEPPSFTKPAIFGDSSAPNELLSGDHKKIAQFRSRLSSLKTRFFRPDLRTYNLNAIQCDR